MDDGYRQGVEFALAETRYDLQEMCTASLRGAGLPLPPYEFRGFGYSEEVTAKAVRAGLTSVQISEAVESGCKQSKP